MKKCIAFFAIVALLVCGVQPKAFAKSAVYPMDIVSIALDDVTAAAGEVVELSLSISGSYEANILHIFIDYDVDSLQLNGRPTAGAVWAAIENVGGIVLTNTEEAGRIGFIAIVPQGSFTDDGIVFTASFHVSEECENGTVIPVSLSVEQFSNDALDGSSTAVQFSQSSGSVTVQDEPDVEPGSAAITVSSAETEAGETVEIEVSVEGEYEANILHMFVDYDSDVLELQDEPASGEVWNAINDANGVSAVNADEPGRLGFIAITPNSTFSANGNLFTLTFVVSDSAEAGATYDITVTIPQFSYDDLAGASNAVECYVENGAVTIVDPVPDTHTVTFIDGHSGDIISTVTVKHGEAAAAPDAPEYMWFVFTGWDVDFNEVTEDLTVTAQYAEKGDINGDGSVDMRDALQLMRYLMGSDTIACDEEEADFNSDGSVDLMDALLLMRHVLGTIPD